MAYTKQNFTNGMTLTADHLNKMEQGIVDAHNLGESGFSGSGLNDTAKVLLLNILRNGVFSTNQASNITALEAALGSGGGESGDGGGTTSTYAIINNLTNVTTNNTASSVAANDSYTAALTANENCELVSVTVTMGGADITTSVYADGKVNISSVTGIVVITAVAEGTSAAYIQDGLEHEFTSLSANKTISGGQSIFNSGADFTVFVAAKKTDTMKNYAHDWIGYGSSSNLEFYFRRNWNKQISLTAAEADDASMSVDNNKTWKCPDGVDVDGMIYAWVVKSGSTITAYCNDIKLGTIAQENAKIFDGDLKINNSKYPTPKVLIYNRALSADECTQNYNSMIAEVGA